MKKLFLSAVAVIGLMGANYTIMPYGAFLSYDNSVKDKGYIGGIYGTIYKSPIKFEYGIERDIIQYKDTTPDWKQWNFTGVFNFFKGYNYVFRAGLNHLKVSQGNTKENDNVYILGTLYYKYLNYNSGIDFYHSKYKDFKVNQVSLKYGKYFKNYDGTFYFEIKPNFIFISDKIKANTPKKNYTDVDFKLTATKWPWITTLKASVGKNAYKVENGGFVVYNLGEEYKYNYGINVSRYFKNIGTFSVGFSRSKFSENNQDSYSNVYLLTYTRAF
ncbi:hypothetical protein FE773_04915 [Caminibacter mediatlanticus TB-2]|uniref:DUF2490 domain-containing protein n=1 Tax=Caminibacter mediatlanticus TB-2 TaxID=391592 RepID=A0ABX5V8C5_9BACT|nr:hypothetical protein [Caminibacter mediatlanticus]QCT94540.1 hypothetical protein FE773_04915 [Caminibacter mediatlanticus TB-2]